jgi:hypothetical protein
MTYKNLELVELDELLAEINDLISGTTEDLAWLNFYNKKK